MVAAIDLERAYFYASVCTQQYEKSMFFGLTEAVWDECGFAFVYCREVLGNAYFDRMKATQAWKLEQALRGARRWDARRLGVCDYEQYKAQMRAAIGVD